MINRAELLGRLARDPELSSTARRINRAARTILDASAVLVEPPA